MKASNLIYRLVLAGALMASWSSQASADLIIDFDFSGVAGTSFQNKETFELTATSAIDPNLSINEGVNFKSPSQLLSTNTGGQSANDLNLNNWSGGNDVSSAINDSRYFSFTLQANSGYRMNLNGASVNFTAWRNGPASPEVFGLLAQTVPNDGNWLPADQIGGDAIPFGGPSPGSLGSGSTGIGGTQSFSFVFSGAEWDKITDAVEFRLYGWSGTSNLHVRDASISGASVTAVPEPGGVAVLLGIAGLTVIRRRWTR